jgi:hypothetical protein
VIDRLRSLAARARLPRQVRAVPTMLSAQELHLLYGLGRRFSGEGRIVDAGCFLGGSTVALGAGLRDGGTAAGPVIRTYDLFRAGWWTRDSGFADVEQLEDGASFRPVFDRYVAPVAPWVEVVEGDVHELEWTGEPIEVAFLDVLKDWEANDRAVAQLFGHLLPGRGIVVQQDFVHEFCPWIAVTMGRLEPYFELVGVRSSSAVYRCIRPLPADAAAEPGSSLPAERKLQLFERGIAPLRGRSRGIVECARAYLLFDLHGLDAGLEEISALRGRHGSDRVLRARIGDTEAGMRAAHANAATSG